MESKPVKWSWFLSPGFSDPLRFCSILVFLELQIFTWCFSCLFATSFVGSWWPDDIMQVVVDLFFFTGSSIHHFLQWKHTQYLLVTYTHIRGQLYSCYNHVACDEVELFSSLSFIFCLQGIQENRLDSKQHGNTDLWQSLFHLLPSLGGVSLDRRFVQNSCFCASHHSMGAPALSDCAFILIKVKSSLDFVIYIHFYFVSVTPAAGKTPNTFNNCASIIQARWGRLLCVVGSGVNCPCIKMDIFCCCCFLNKQTNKATWPKQKEEKRRRQFSNIVSFICVSSKTQTSCKQCRCFDLNVLFVVKSCAQLTWPPPHKGTCFVCT